MNGALYPLFLIFYFLRFLFSLILTIMASLMDISIGRPRQRQTMFGMFETDTDR